ncbi:MAG TPA: hypothetical protein VGJ73_05990 [Verrucomicrobiae bacterium]|jgi:hypothetical protein
MAKSIRLSDIEAPRAHVSSLSRGSFWENWFEGEPASQKQQAHSLLDEHNIWEKAVNLEILAFDDKKF